MYFMTGDATSNERRGYAYYTALASTLDAPEGLGLVINTSGPDLVGRKSQQVEGEAVKTTHQVRLVVPLSSSSFPHVHYPIQSPHHVHHAENPPTQSPRTTKLSIFTIVPVKGISVDYLIASMRHSNQSIILDFTSNYGALTDPCNTKTKILFIQQISYYWDDGILIPSPYDHSVFLCVQNVCFEHLFTFAESCSVVSYFDDYENKETPTIGWTVERVVAVEKVLNRGREGATGTLVVVVD
jgi:hypothetical protein